MTVHSVGCVPTLLSLQFDRDAENCGMQASISDKGVLFFNQALIHMRVRMCWERGGGRMG